MHSQVEVTPPQSFTSNPLTPPPTTEKDFVVASSIIAKIRGRQSGQGCLTRPWTRYKLNEDEYTELLRGIRKDSSLQGYVDNKVRYDYSHFTDQLILRMPTALHERIISRVVRDLQSQLEELEGGGDDASAKFAGQVKSWGSTTLKFPDAEFGRHDPDAQFRHSNARYPSVVIEVSYSQKRKDVWNLVDDYILGSDGEIQVVISLDIEYRNSKKATFSVWRPSVETNEAGEKELVAKQTIVDQMFRDEEGNAITDSHAGLHLQLGDFSGNASVSPTVPLTAPIGIPATKLYLFLQEAEEEVSNMESEYSVPASAQTWTKKRRRKATPPEELDERREKRFQTDESNAIQTAEADDSSYNISSDEDEV